jgi:hypothetical protein
MASKGEEMKIEIVEFETGTGVVFLITAKTIAEQALLGACVSRKGNTLQEQGVYADRFFLHLPVSNS